MASFPPQRPAAQRRASPPEEASSAQQEQAARTNSFSAQSVDSQTLLLNSPPHESATPAVEPHKEAPHASHTAPSEDDEPRKCWICFTDETEDDETTSEWRAPCVCSLVAHEKCLLDWIADMEAPSSRRTVGPRASRIQCPQCKSEIRITRPGSFVVDAVRLGERLISTLLLPGVAIVTGTALYSTLALAGTHTVYQLFGPQDALHILAPLYEKPDLGIASPVLRLFSHLQQHWRLHLGLPLIPTVLIASRTTLADSFLPFLPLIFFAGSGQPGDELIQLQWPPSAAFSFAALPYLRGFYNAFYDRICLPKERQWLEEIQPRAGTEDAADAEAEVEHGHDHHDHHHHDHHHNDHHHHDHHHNDHHHHDHHHHDHHHDHDHEEIEEVEIQVDFDIFGYWNGEGIGIQDPQHAPVPPGPAQPLNAPPLLHAEAQGAAPAPNVPLQPPQPHVRRVHHEANIALSASSIADAILGALILPSIAAAMGELLHHTLPTSWVTLPSSTPSMSWLGGWIATGGKVGGKSRPTGFLQTRWGRSLVGGCLFVGLKDAVLLYVRWKMAQNHRRRRILDCDPKDRKIGKTS